MPPTTPTIAPKTEADDGSRRWGASIVSTFVTLVLSFYAWAFVGMMPIECEMYCEAPELRHFYDSYRVAYRFFVCGLLVPLLALLESYRLTWRRQHPTRRIMLTLAAPLAVFFLYLITASWVDASQP
jgi:hypothetical protein